MTGRNDISAIRRACQSVDRACVTAIDVCFTMAIPWPHMDCAIEATRGDRTATGQPYDRENPVLTGISIDMLSAESIPHLDCAVAVIAPRCDVLPIRRPGNAAHKAYMAAIGNKSIRCLCSYMPDKHVSTGIARRNVFAI